MTKQEQKYIILLIVVAIFFVGYKFIWQPIANKNYKLKLEIQNKVDLLSWMKGREGAIDLLRAAPKINENQKNISIISAVTKELEQQKLSQLKHDISQSDQSSVTLTFSEAPFDDIMRLITELRKNYDIIVKNLTAVKDPKKEGAVRISFTLER